MSNWLFWFFAAMTVLPVIYMVLAKNVIRAAFALVATLLGLAALYVLLNATYVAVVQILIYAGGIIILLVFGIMLTKRVSDEGVMTKHHQLLTGSILGIGLLIALIRLIYQTSWKWDGMDESSDQVKEIGFLMLTDHLFAFELIAFILLLALVGAAFLAKKSDNA